MIKNNGTLIIDLDGTLIDCNSFTEFVHYLFAKLPGKRIHIASIVIQRKLRVISHHEAKCRIVRLAASGLTESEIDDFVKKLQGLVHQSLLERVQRAGRVILATAAPEIYARPFAEAVGITEVTATTIDGAENTGHIKLGNVLRMGAEFNENTTVITDHYDDMPLLKHNARGHNILINPDATTQMHLKLAGIKFAMQK